jgi:hypothetical protein
MTEYSINTIPEYKKVINEAETFLDQLCDGKYKPTQWVQFWYVINRVVIKMSKLEKKWKGEKETLNNPV